MITIEQIKKYKTRYEELYKGVRVEQEQDMMYREDKFDVLEIQEPHTVYRTGVGPQMVDNTTAHVITTSPKAYIDTGNKEVDVRLSKAANRWLDILRRQNPNAYKDLFKNKLCEGESYLQVIHDENWLNGNTNWMPVNFVTRSPMVIWGSPEEDKDGVPDRVLIWYERFPWDVIYKYPNWKNPKHRNLDKPEKVDWLEYWDKDVRYWEADGDPVLKKGINPNVYKRVPFIRKYSGMGYRSQDGDLSKLIVGLFRHSRDLLKAECVAHSNIMSILTLFAARDKIIISPGEVNEEQVRALEFGGYNINVLSNMAEGTEYKNDDLISPPPEMLRHHADLMLRLNQLCPFLMAGFPMGDSGRQQGMTTSAGHKLIENMIEGTELQVATGIEMAFQITKRIPKLIPDGINKSDLDREIHCRVELRADDPMERANKITLGDRLYAQGNGSIDLRTFLIEYVGKTQDETEKIIVQKIIDKMTIYNPNVEQVWGLVFAEETGMQGYLEKIKQQGEMEQEKAQGLQNMPPASTQERTQGQFNPGVTEEETDKVFASREYSNKGARTPPPAYTRG